MLKSGTKPYAHSTNSPKWHGRRNLSAERKHYLSLHFLFVPKKFDFLFSLKSNSWFVNIKLVRKWRCWKGYQAFLFIETVKNAILLILYKERTFLRMLQGEDDMSKACSLGAAILGLPFSLCFKTFSSPLGSNTWRVTEKWHFTEHSVYDNCH